MFRKQRIIVSITGIVLVSLILIGLTYGYYLTKIKGNTNSKSISVVTANLLLEYADVNDELITDSAVEPGKSWTKTFVATNKGNKTLTYGVALENVVNQFERKDDIVYTLDCKQYSKTGFSIDKTNKTVTGTISGTCNGVSEETTFPSIGTILVQNDIADDKAQVYTLTITYKETNTDQSVDMNKTFSAKANIVDPNTFSPYGEGTLASAILSNGAKIKVVDTEKTEFVEDTLCGYGLTCLENVANDCPGTCVKEGTEVIYKNIYTKNIKNNPDLSKIANGSSWNDELSDLTNDGLFSETDDYGISYYYRGPIDNNYVFFANKLWRIVKINGDGTIKLVLDDVAKNSGGNIIKTKFFYNSELDPEALDNIYIGYMYGTPGSNSYDNTHKNINDSTIKTQVDAWYKTNIVDTNNTDYIADTLFCNDKSVANSTVGIDNTALGYGTNKTYYASVERLQYSTGTTSITTSKPTFKCAENATNDYSRFTVSVSTLSNGNKTNGNLTYPVGLLTADEVAYAGANSYNQANKKYYLYNSSITSEWWLLSAQLSGAIQGAGYMFVVSPSNGLLNYTTSNSLAFRPVLNLKAETLKSAGDGTKENPYTVKLS